MPSFMQRKRDELGARGVDPDRLPPGQYVTERFPVLHLGPVPRYCGLDDWTLAIGGDAVARPRVLTWAELCSLPEKELTADVHCVTKWTKLDLSWRGVLLDDVLAASLPGIDAITFVAVAEHDYSASTSWAELSGHDAMLAWAVDGSPLDPEHGYPLRLVVPHLYFWKSVKWLRRIELWRDERAGYWEHHGYHHHGDPFAEERYWGDAASRDVAVASANSSGALSRPLRVLLERALAKPTGTVSGDVASLRAACAVVLRRCLDRPDGQWAQLVELASDKGDWDQWRQAGLLAAAEPERDATAEATRDLLAELADELCIRGDVLPGVWEGEQRQAVTASADWQEGKRRRDLVTSLERLVELIETTDAPGLRELAGSIARRDTGDHPTLPAAVRAAAADIEATGAVPARTRASLAECLQETPFAAAIVAALDPTATATSTSPATLTPPTHHQRDHRRDDQGAST